MGREKLSTEGRKKHIYFIKPTYAGYIRRYSTFHWWICFRKFLCSVQESKKVALGKLLDHRRIVFLAYYSAAGGLGNCSGIFKNHFRNITVNFLVDVHLGNFMGNRRFDVRVRHALSWIVARQFCVAWFYISIWRTCTFHLLQFCSD